MTQFDPTAINGGVSEKISSYEGPAPALVFEAYRDKISISATHGSVSFDDPTLATPDDTFFASVSGSADGEFIGHQGASFGSLSVTLVHVPTGTIFSASETMRYGQTDLSEEVYEAFGQLLENPAWYTDYTNDDGIEFAASAADLEISETMGSDGDPETLLGINGVTLSLDGPISTLETEKLSFEDGSILFVADADGSDFHVQHAARDAATADNQLVGLSGDYKLIGGRGDDKISGGAGDDHLIGRRGDDTIVATKVTTT